MSDELLVTSCKFQVSSYELQVYRKGQKKRITIFRRQERRLSTGRLGDVFVSLAFVFFPAIVPRAYTLPAVRYTLIKH